MNSEGTVRVRYAPSPTGLPHLGNIRTALLNWLFARRHGGQFIFRLEDTDRERYNPESEQALIDALRWLGLDYDEGPDIGGPYAPYSQSQRLEHYRAATDRLIADGHAYRCFCTRERIQQIREARQAANIHPYGYDRHCRALTAEDSSRRKAAGEPYVIRFAIPMEGETSFQDAVRGTITYRNRELDDHVLLKSDGFPTYQLANVVDDHLMGITHVIRAEEWIPSTPRHVLEYQALGWELPVFAHASLIHGRDPKTGKTAKLSKRHGAVYAGEYREQGYLPEALFNYLALLGWSPGGDREVMTRDEMVSLFSLSGLSSSPAVFDIEKLTWMNGLYIRGLTPPELLERCLPFLQSAGMASTEPDAEERANLERILTLEQERMKLLAEAPDLTGFFIGELPQYDEAAVSKRLRSAKARPVLDAMVRRLEPLAQWETAAIEEAATAVAEELGVGRGDVIHPTRVAATGRAIGPGLFETLWTLGRERTMARLRHARDTYTLEPGG